MFLPLAKGGGEGVAERFFSVVSIPFSAGLLSIKQPSTFGSAVEALEQRLITEAFQQVEGDKEKEARLLNIRERASW